MMITRSVAAFISTATWNGLPAHLREKLSLVLQADLKVNLSVYVELGIQCFVVSKKTHVKSATTPVDII